MKTIESINEKIASGKAVVLTAEEIISYARKKGIEKAAEEVDVVTTATFGPMCSSGCFLNTGHSRPKMRITEAWVDDVPAYAGIAAADLYLGATQLRHNDPANMYYPGEFRYGGGHVIEKLIAGETVQLFALSYGTDDYPRKEVRTYMTIDDFNQATMVNPRNCYQNYNVAVNSSDKTIYTYLGMLRPEFKNAGYSTSGQLSPLLNDPYLKTIGVGTKIWLAGADGIVYSEGTQHSGVCDRGENGVPSEGAGTLALSADMKKMDREYVRGLSIKGYGVSLSLGIGIPIPILSPEILKATTVKDEDIFAPVIDYATDYPEATGKILKKVSYSELKSGAIELNGKQVATGTMSSYHKARKIAALLQSRIQDGSFLLGVPHSRLSLDVPMKPMPLRQKPENGRHAP